MTSRRYLLHSRDLPKGAMRRRTRSRKRVPSLPYCSSVLAMQLMVMCPPYPPDQVDTLSSRAPQPARFWPWAPEFGFLRARNRTRTCQLKRSIVSSFPPEIAQRTVIVGMAAERPMVSAVALVLKTQERSIRRNCVSERPSCHYHALYTQIDV